MYTACKIYLYFVYCSLCYSDAVMMDDGQLAFLRRSTFEDGEIDKVTIPVKRWGRSYGYLYKLLRKNGFQVKNKFSL